MFQRVLGVLNGRDNSPELLRKWAFSADKLLAADGGADLLAEAGFAADVIVGDLDSVSPESMRKAREICRNEDQTYTDCDKLLSFAGDHEYTPLVVTAVEGDRLDHVLATIHSVARSAIRSKVTLALRSALAWVLGPGDWERAVVPGRGVSLIPLQRSIVKQTHGLRWPLANQVLDASELTSISNETAGTELRISIETGLALLTVEYPQEEFPIW